MITKKQLSISLIFIMSVVVFVFSIGCDKDDEGEQDDQNGNEEIDFEINYGSLSDIDGNDYNTIVIGGQEWMAENLKVTRYNNGDSLTANLSDNLWSNISEGAYAFWNDDTAMLEAYGMFYNWYAVDDSRNICPSGWRVPTQYDWQQLTDHLINTYDVITNDNVGNYLKSCRQQGSPLGGDCDTQEHPAWNGHYEHYGTDDFGFSATPAGWREADGNYSAIGYLGLFWTASEVTSSEAVIFGLSYDSGKLEMGGDAFNNGLCIRCIKE